MVDSVVTMGWEIARASGAGQVVLPQQAPKLLRDGTLNGSRTSSGPCLESRDHVSVASRGLLIRMAPLLASLLNQVIGLAGASPFLASSNVNL